MSSLSILLMSGTLFAAPIEAPYASQEIDPVEWVGSFIHSVQIISPNGGVPEESLAPLLRSRQGDPLDPAAIRNDLTTLFFAGDFASVDAEVEPWVAYDEAGEPMRAVILSYVVTPAPRLRKLIVDAPQWRGRIRHWASLEKGDRFFAEVDGPALTRQLKRKFASNGYPDAEIHIETIQIGERVDVILQAVPGTPRLLRRVEFSGNFPVSTSRLRRIARKAGFRKNKPFHVNHLEVAQAALRQDLAAPSSLFRRGGWVKNRITPVLSGDATEGFVARFHIEAGPRLKLDAKGLGWNSRSKARHILGIDERVRLTRGFLETAPERLNDWLQRRGFRNASAEVSLIPKKDTEILKIRIRHGARVYLTPSIGRRYRINFEGNSSIPTKMLRNIMTQASEVLRQGFVTEPELTKSLDAATQLYRSRGYQEAKLTILQRQEVPRPSFLRLSALRKAAAKRGTLPPIDMTLTIGVEEGLLSILDSIELQGLVIDTAPWLEQARQLEKAPYSPQALESLAQSLIQAHREQGYLQATVKVFPTALPDHRVHATLVIRSGPQLLLRSSLITGLSHTRAKFVRRQLNLQLGKPITTSVLEQSRRTLIELGIFQLVDTELLGDDATRDLVIRVVERSRWDFELGGGLSTDQGIRAFARVRRGNVWGLAHRWELYSRLGFQYRSDSLTDWLLDVENPDWRIAASYTAPRFPLRNQSLIVDVIIRDETQERLWRLGRSGLGIAIETTWGHTQLRIGARYEIRQLLEVDRGAILPREPWNALRTGGTLPSEQREQTTVEALLVHDWRDDPVNPTKGGFLSVVAEFSPGTRWLTGRSLDPVTTLKTELRIGGHVRLGPIGLRLSGATAFAHGFQGGVLPLEERYRLGGTGSLRGFRRETVGPQNEVGPADIPWPTELAPTLDEHHQRYPTRWVSTGGDARAQGSAEVIIPLPVLGLNRFDGYSAALFTDVGNVWSRQVSADSDQDKIADIYHPLFRYAVGAGLRVTTPIGPLQFDLALNPDAAFAKGQRKILLQEIWEEPLLRIHVSLGTLF